MDREKMAEFYNYWRNATPGKYWKLPSNKKHLIGQYLEDKNYLAMVKYDGYWSRHIIGENEVCLVQSRGISKVTGTYGDYTPLIPHITEELGLSVPPGTVLVGELCYPNDLSRKATDVGKILRCKAPKAIERQQVHKDKLHARYFDILAYKYEDVRHLPFEERFALLEEVVGLGNFIDTAEAADDAKLLLKNVWNAGGEGIILLDKHQPYNNGGAKAWHSIKVKRELGEIEGKVIGLVEPTKEYSGEQGTAWPYWIIYKNVNFLTDKEAQWVEIDRSEDGYLGVRCPDCKSVPVTKPYYYGWKSGIVVEYKGRTIRITSGTTDDDAQYLAGDAAKKLIGEGNLWAVFTGMELTPDSVRHPNLIRLRDDM